MATRLILIRHGQTDWNLENKYCGFVDIGLNCHGRKQAQRLHERLKEIKVDRIYSSDRKRAIQTARIIFKKKKFKKMPDLREMHFGIFEGLTYKEIMKRHSRIYRKWINDSFKVTIPDGEDSRGFKKRVVKGFKEIVSLNQNKTVAAICHGGTISMFINHILRKNDFWKLIPNTASLSIVEYKNGKPEIRLLNDTSHLASCD